MNTPLSRAPGLLVLWALIGCRGPELQRTLPPDVRIDTYTQQAASNIDVLWVVDNSGSMAPRQENLARNFQAFIETFTKNSIDYRLAVTTTDLFVDKGRFVGTPSIITPKTPSPAAAFAANVKVGIAGSPYEAGLEAAAMSLEKQRAENDGLVSTCKGKCGQNDTACTSKCETETAFTFLRTGAYLYLIFVADEEDRSERDIRYYYRLFETAKGIGNDGTVTTAAIMGDDGNSCGATFGQRYLQLSELTGGAVGSICDENFSASLKKLASNAVGLRRKFALQLPPNQSTLEVRVLYPCNFANAEALGFCAKVDRSACTEGVAPQTKGLVCTPVQKGPDGWEYEPANNVVFFAGESVPALGADIELQYYEEGKSP